VPVDEPYRLDTPSDDKGWHAVLERYGGPVDREELLAYLDTPDEVDPQSAVRLEGLIPLYRALDVARRGGATCVVTEYRYVDLDFRSEYAAFWASRFNDHPAFAQRMHFFRDLLDEQDLHRIDPQTCGYLGYIILRPVRQGLVGRTLLAPPPDLVAHEPRLVDVSDDISFFGTDLNVVGAPFSQQDGEYLRCAHASVWMCHYIAYRKRLTGRVATANLVNLSPPEPLGARALPSAGLHLGQMQAVFSATGLPALLYELGHLPSVLGVEQPPEVAQEKPPKPYGAWDHRVISVACRYLNSGFPVLVTTSNHAFVLVGYYFRADGKVTFVASDDQLGPYVEIEDPLADPLHEEWWELMVPLPPKVYLTGESAENDAVESILNIHKDPDATDFLRQLHKDYASDQLAVRTFLQRGRDYKANLARQNRDDEVVRELRLARMSHWVWIVEVHDHATADHDKHVRAEFVYDSTSYDLQPARLAVSFPDVTTVIPPDDGPRRYANTGDRTAWRSQLWGLPD